MRKHLAALLIAALSTCVSTHALAQGAAEWTTKEVKWGLTNQGGPAGATAIWHRDTTFNVIAAGQTDTTSNFSLEHLADIVKPSAAAGDTLILGYLVFAQDSVGATASSVTSITVEIDGALVATSGTVAGQGGAWKQLDSLVVRTVASGAVNDGVAIVPIRTKSLPIGNHDPGGAADAPEPRLMALACDRFRARITAATGVMTAAKVFVRFRKNITGEGSRQR